MRLVPLTSDYELTPFDCGDSDLNEFLFNDAKKALELRIAERRGRLYPPDVLRYDGCALITL